MVAQEAALASGSSGSRVRAHVLDGVLIFAVTLPLALLAMVTQPASMITVALSPVTLLVAQLCAWFTTRETIGMRALRRSPAMAQLLSPPSPGATPLYAIAGKTAVPCRTCRTCRTGTKNPTAGTVMRARAPRSRRQSNQLL